MSQTDWINILELSHRCSSASDAELVEAIKQNSLPPVLQMGRRVYNKGRATVMGYLIAEAGRRQLVEPVPAIVEYCVWQDSDEHPAYLDVKALRALKNIGDPSCIQRLEEIAEIVPANTCLIRSTIHTLREDLPTGGHSGDIGTGTLSAQPSHEAKVVYAIAAWSEGVWSADDVVKWADCQIEKTEEPPWWLCEIATFGPQASTPGYEMPTASFRQCLQVFVWGWKTGRLSLPVTLIKIYHACDEYEQPEFRDSEDLDSLLYGAVLEWMEQECHAGGDLRHEPGWEREKIDIAGRDRRWTHPNELDHAGKLLYQRIVAIMNAIFDDAVELRNALEC